MHIFKKLLLLCALFVSAFADASCLNPPVLPNGSIVYSTMAGEPITQSIDVSGGTPPYTLETTGLYPIVNGSVTFNDVTEEFTFTQDHPGASRMTVRIRDDEGCLSNTRNIYFYSCPDGNTAAVAMGNNNNQIALIYAICYPSYVPLDSVFNITVSVVNVNPEGIVPSGPFRDFIPDQSQVTFAPGLEYVNTISLSPEITSFNPAIASSINKGGMGEIIYDFNISSGVSVDAVIQIQATAEGQQTYTARNIFNPGNELTPVSIFVGPPCSVVANTATENLCSNSVLTGDLEQLVNSGIPPYTFGPTGNTVGGIVTISPSGIYTFTADVGFSGLGSFEYEVSDSNTGCGPVSNLVNVFVDGLNVSNTAVELCSDDQVSGNLQSLVANGVPPYVFTPGANIIGGGLIVEFDGDYTFFPNPGLSGPAGFDFVVADSLGCTAAGLVDLNFSPCCPLSDNPFMQLISALYWGFTGI